MQDRAGPTPADRSPNPGDRSLDMTDWLMASGLCPAAKRTARPARIRAIASSRVAGTGGAPPFSSGETRSYTAAVQAMRDSKTRVCARNSQSASSSRSAASRSSAQPVAVSQMRSKASIRISRSVRERAQDSRQRLTEACGTPGLHRAYSNSMMTASTARLSPGPALIFATTPRRSARRMFSIFIASTVQSAWPS